MWGDSEFKDYDPNAGRTVTAAKQRLREDRENRRARRWRRFRDWRTFKLLGRPWQDLVFAAGEIVFLVALVPLLFTDARIPLYTGLSTGGMLYLFGLCQASYRNWITLALGLTTATLWVLLGVGVRL